MADDNPDFGTWALAYVMYCDGSSYTSNLSETRVYNNTQVFFRGRRILDGLLASWSDALPDVSDVIVSGSSAGGLTVYLHLDTIAEHFQALSPSTRVVGMVDAGYFLNHSNTQGVDAFGAEAYSALPVWGTSPSSFDRSCVEAEGQYQDCFFAAVAFQHLATPVFVTNSMIDAWQLGNVLQVGCNLQVGSAGSCQATQLAAIENWRTDFLKAMQPVIRRATYVSIVQC